MDFDIRCRESRLEKEAKLRRANAMSKIQAEKLEFAAQKSREAQRAEQLYILKLKKEQEEEARLLAEQAEQVLTGGIKCQQVDLIPYEIDGEDDKIILPESVLETLTAQDAFNHGAILFQLSVNSGRITHSGIREFTAAPDTIGLPPKVYNTLKICAASRISIKYVQLSKCTYVKLQPLFNDFFNVGPVKECLEENLRKHSTMTVGDELTVWYRGKAHPLRVIELKPDIKGTLIDSDVEVDLDLSQEHVNNLQTSLPLPPPQQQQQPSSLLSKHVDKICKLEQGSLSEPMSVGVSQDFNIVSVAPEDYCEDAAATATIAVRVRTPANSVLTRKFSKDKEFLQLFQFVSYQLHMDINKIVLTTRFPNKQYTTLDTANNVTFQDISSLAGSTQETFMMSATA